MNIKDKIRVVPDFPKVGISFKDITTIIHDADVFAETVKQMADLVKNLDFDYILAPEARGFIFGTALAIHMKKGFIPVRKSGKLPFECEKVSYELEYGTDTLEIHKDALKQGDKVLIVDDVLATGGTARALAQLVENSGAEVVAYNFLMELDFIDGREKLKEYQIYTLVHYQE